MTTFYDVDRANERLPELREVLEHLRRQRGEIIALRDHLAALGGEAVPDDDRSIVEDALDGSPDSPRLIAARMQAVIDQMQAGVSRLDAWSIQLRSIEDGLIDFPALANGRQVWLCWRLDDDEVSFWHEMTAGFGSRRPLIELT